MIHACMCARQGKLTETEGKDNENSREEEPIQAKVGETWGALFLALLLSLSLSLSLSLFLSLLSL